LRGLRDRRDPGRSATARLASADSAGPEAKARAHVESVGILGLFQIIGSIAPPSSSGIRTDIVTIRIVTDLSSRFMLSSSHIAIPVDVGSVIIVE